MDLMDLMNNEQSHYVGWTRLPGIFRETPHTNFHCNADISVSNGKIRFRTFLRTFLYKSAPILFILNKSEPLFLMNQHHFS